jgi:hypothetical protein
MNIINSRYSRGLMYNKNTAILYAAVISSFLWLPCLLSDLYNKAVAQGTIIGGGSAAGGLQLAAI